MTAKFFTCPTQTACLYPAELYKAAAFAAVVVKDLFGDAVQNFVHFHAGRVPVVPKADDNDSVLLGQNGLIDLPAVVEMR